MKTHHHLDTETGRRYTDQDAGFCPSVQGMDGQIEIPGPIPADAEVETSATTLGKDHDL